MSHGLPPNPMRGSPSTRETALPSDTPSGFSRSGFAPLPHRHSEYTAPPPSHSGSAGHEERDWDTRGRGGPPGGGWNHEMDERDRWSSREDWDRRPPPPRWEDEYDRPKRRRSPSPFGASHRQRMHSPSPPPSLRYPPSSGMIDPAELPQSLTYRQFADWFRASHPQTARADEEELKRHRHDKENGIATGKERIGMAKRYERYRKEYHSRQLYAIYLTHRESPWFLERYSIEPTYVTQRRRVNRQGRVRTVEQYLDTLRTGEHDNLSYDFSAETSGRGSTSRDHDEPEGLDRALGDAPVDDALRVEVPPAQRQVFIKTVPPHIGRSDLEELFKSIKGFEYLALTEPAMKKSFHRVGWAQFAPGIEVQDVVHKLDNSKIDNFTFHMGVNATPVVGKIRLTAPIANTLDRLQRDAQKAKELAEKLEEELLGDDEPKEGSGAVKEGEEKVEDENRPLADGELGIRQRGSEIVQEKIDEILQKEGLNGDELEDEQVIRKTKIALDQWISYLRHGLSTCYYCVASMSFPEELHRKCIAHMRPLPSATSTSINEVSEPVRGGDRDEDDHGKEEYEASKQDRYEEEERRDDEDSRPHRGGRRILTALRSEDEKFEELLDGRLKAVLDPDVDVTEYGGRDIEEETQKLTAPMIKQEEASKYRCKDCNKLFKAPEFVVKHIASKHPELTKTRLDEISTFNNYVLDPQRIQPSPAVLAAVNDALPSTLPLALPNMAMPFGATPNFNPAFANMNPAGASNGGGGPGGGMDRMMQQQMMMMMQMQQAMMMAQQNGMGGNGHGGHGGQGGGGGLEGRIGGFADTPAGPPPGGEDPRAKRGRVSYLDLDEPGGGGDGGLPY